MLSFLASCKQPSKESRQLIIAEKNLRKDYQKGVRMICQIPESVFVQEDFYKYHNKQCIANVYYYKTQNHLNSGRVNDAQNSFLHFIKYQNASDSNLRNNSEDSIINKEQLFLKTLMNSKQSDDSSIRALKKQLAYFKPQEDLHERDEVNTIEYRIFSYKLYSYSIIFVFFCILVIQLEEHIISANAGDSRGIMIFDDSNNNNLTKTKIYPLSYDCKPENPLERQRIYEHGGIVKQITDENGNELGPYRVWIKGETYPGLAMSRSIGDLEAKTIGVIPNPQIIEYLISRKTKYMIICSDGIWEFISNKEAMEIGNKYYLRNDPLGLCNELKNKATKIWMKEDSFIDDITVVVVFF